MKKPFLYYFNLMLVLILSEIISIIIAKNLTLKITILELVSKLIFLFFLMIQYFFYRKFNKKRETLQDADLVINYKNTFKIDLYNNSFKEFYSGNNPAKLKINTLLFCFIFFYLVALIGSIIQSLINPLLKNLPFFIKSGYIYFEALKKLFKDNPFLSFFLIVIIGPIIEEFTFRGFSLSVYQKGKKAIFITILMSIIFALMHFDLSRLFPLFAMGLALGTIYNLTESLLYTIIIHVINNFISYLSLFYIMTAKDLVNFEQILNSNVVKNEFNIFKTILLIWFSAILVILTNYIYEKIRNKVKNNQYKEIN